MTYSCNSDSDGYIQFVFVEETRKQLYDYSYIPSISFCPFRAHVHEYRIQTFNHTQICNKLASLKRIQLKGMLLMLMLLLLVVKMM